MEKEKIKEKLAELIKEVMPEVDEDIKFNVDIEQEYGVNSISIIKLIIAIEINKETGIQFDVVFSCINYLILLIQWIVMILLEDYAIFLESSLLLVVLILNRNGLNEMIRTTNALISAKFKAISSK